METTTDQGRRAESIAAIYLEMRGYRILERNVRSSRLEIDLLARQRNLLAVVEVKYRDRPRRGGALAAVSARKQRDLETAVLGYLRRTGLSGLVIRFDVIAIESSLEGRVMRLLHVPGAFEASGRYRA